MLIIKYYDYILHAIIIGKFINPYLKYYIPTDRSTEETLLIFNTHLVTHK